MLTRLYAKLRDIVLVPFIELGKTYKIHTFFAPENFRHCGKGKLPSFPCVLALIENAYGPASLGTSLGRASVLVATLNIGVTLPHCAKIAGLCGTIEGFVGVGAGIGAGCTPVAAFRASCAALRACMASAHPSTKAKCVKRPKRFSIALRAVSASPDFTSARFSFPARPVGVFGAVRYSTR